MIAIVISYGFKIYRFSLSSYSFQFVIGYSCLKLGIKYYNSRKYLDILNLFVFTIFLVIILNL